MTPLGASQETGNKDRELGRAAGSGVSAAGATNTPPPYTSHGTTTALTAYRVASGQKPPGIQVTMCEGCGGSCRRSSTTDWPSMSHGRWGPQALRRAFTLENLHWLCSSCHRRKTRLDRRLARFLSACSLDWRGALGEPGESTAPGPARVPRSSRDSLTLASHAVMPSRTSAPRHRRYTAVRYGPWRARSDRDCDFQDSWVSWVGRP